MCDHPSHSLRFDRRRFLAALPTAATALALTLRPGFGAAGPVDLPSPGPRDTCPVCGMFVAKYPEWVATVLYADGEAVHFDGAKDFFKYLADMEKYAPGRNIADIASMGVTEYYGLKLVDAKEALFVIGSDVYGPMGHELVPLANEVDATDFNKDHRGVRIVAFDEVTPEILAGLDQGRFE